MVPSLLVLCALHFLWSVEKVKRRSITLIPGEVWVLRWETVEGVQTLTLHGFSDLNACKIFAAFKFRHFGFWDGNDFLENSQRGWPWLDDEGCYHENDRDHRGKEERCCISI